MAAFIFAITLMVLDHYTHAADTLRNALLNILQPIEYLSALPGTLYDAYRQNTADQIALQKKAAALHAQNLMLQARLQKMAELQQENRRLRLLLDASGQLPSDRMKLIIATVLRAGNRPDAEFLILNKGALDGITPDMPVLDANGVLGLITHISELTSQARLLTDPDLEIPVRFERTGLRAITRGLGHGQLEVDFVRTGADVRVGDLLVTSGLGGVYPAGYPVARVTAVRQRPQATFMQLTAVPVSHLYNNHEVLIVHYGAPDS